MITELYPHQRDEVEQYGLEPARGLLWCPRAGKSRTIVYSALRQYMYGKISIVFISAPNGVHRNWVTQEWNRVLNSDQIWIWNTTDSDELQRRTAKAVLDHLDLSVICVPSHIWTMDRAKWLLQWIRNRGKSTMLVADESHEYATPSSKRSRRIRGLAKRCVSRRILTGTPWHNNLLNTWAQLELLGPGLSGYKTYTEYARRYGVYKTRFGAHGAYPKLTGYQRVSEAMDRARRVVSILTAGQLPDMPTVANRLVTVQLSDTGKKELHSILHGMSDDDAAIQLIRLQQCVGRDLPRIDRTISLVRRYMASIIWCRYVEEIQQLGEALTRAGGVRVLAWHGETKPAVREEIMELFGTSDVALPGPTVLIGQYQACGQGVNLSRAEALIYYSCTFDTRLYAQSLQRATLMGGGIVTAYHLCSSGVDAYILRRVRNNMQFAALTADDRTEIDEYTIGGPAVWRNILVNQNSVLE